MLALVTPVLTLIASPFMRLVLMLTPVGSVLSFIWKFINNPICRAVLYVAIVVGAFLIGSIKGHVREHAAMIAQNKVEVARAVAEANAARDAADKKFTAGKFNNRPGLLPGRVRHGTDGFSRD